MTESQQKPFHHLRTTFREYVTHWAVAGAIVTTTGFAPDHWVAHVFHEILDGVKQSSALINAQPAAVDQRAHISTMP